MPRTTASVVKVPLLALFVATFSAHADPPELAAWIRNTTGATGYAGLPANVELVQYSSSAVYVSASGIPAYPIGPWGRDPNVPSNQAWVFKIPRAPVAASGAGTATPLGPIGVLVNGVAVFNALDAMTYQNQGVWHQNAPVVESADFDSCLGHPAPGGVYHHHQNPKCLHDGSATKHSPLLGFAFDGFPIYGPYGFAKSDGSGGVVRIRSSYRARAITQRTSLPDGTALSPAQYGPPVSSTTPLGYYMEDFEYVSGLGDLDAANGRFAVTPEYPGGTYAYVTTIEESGVSAYPYAVGPRYHGVVAQENISMHGHVAITEAVTTYVPTTTPVLKTWILPSSARAAGAGGAFYTTDLTVANTGAADAMLTLKFLGNGVDGRAGAEKTFALGAGKSVTYRDVLASVFGLDSAFGAIRITSASPSLVALGETSTPGGAGGTYGQSVPAAAASDFVVPEAPRSVAAVRENAAFRTNLILANATEVDLVVAVSLVSETGATLGAKSYALPPLGMIQVTRVVRDLGVTADVSGARLVLSTSTASGAFAAYAALIDAVTNDPRTLLPR